jgi:Ni/Co efflux regulator RcnB
LIRSSSIVSTAAVVAALTAAPALAKENVERAMNQARQTIDALVERLKNVKPTVDKIAHILGSPKFEKNGAATVRIDSPPFESAYVEEYRRVFKIRFTMSAGTWQLKDITENVNAWSLGPALPDSGRMEAVRDWDWKDLEVRCITEVDGEGSLGNQLVKEVRCQVTSE